MNKTRLVLMASTLLGVLSLAAAAWAVPGDGGAQSGGAKALPVVPSAGGGSEPAPDESGQLGGTSGELPSSPPVLPPVAGTPDTAQGGAGSGEDILVPVSLVPADPQAPTGGVASLITTAVRVIAAALRVTAASLP